MASLKALLRPQVETPVYPAAFPEFDLTVTGVHGSPPPPWGFIDDTCGS